jgi:tetratricopeptide (TPR) repeat protein
MTTERTIRITTGGDLKNYYGLSSEHMDALAVLGFHLYRQGKLKEAETVFNGLIALDEQSFYGHAGLGTVALSQGSPDLQKACKHLEQAVQINPKDPNVHANLGEGLLRSARFKEAARSFETCLALDPGLLQAGSKRARAIIRTIDVISDHVAALASESAPGRPRGS